MNGLTFQNSRHSAGTNHGFREDDVSTRTRVPCDKHREQNELRNLSASIENIVRNLPNEPQKNAPGVRSARVYPESLAIEHRPGAGLFKLCCSSPR